MPKQKIIKSVLGRTWIDYETSERDALSIAQKYELNPYIAQIILNRFQNHETIESYLMPTLKNTMSDPSLLRDMERSVDRVIDALSKNQKIVIYADYDVDGATSSALLRRYFNDIGIETGLYIPDRIDEGYGANPKALEILKKEGYDLVIMCDCGTTSYDALGHAKSIDLDVIVIDHHTAEITLPACYALINPKRIDQEKPGKDAFSDLCAAGLVFVFLVALNRKRRLLKDSPLPDLMQSLDIVALGTVCDVMPLQGLNRSFVTQGLKILNARKNKGLQALMHVSGVTHQIQAYHLGFYLGPRINAGGRVGKADMGSLLLTTEDGLFAQQLADKLNFYNEERKTLEMIVMEQAYAIIEREHLYNYPIILVGAKDWHPGVIGIVASRVKEKYNKPAIIVAFDENDEGKGSGRSVPGIELGEAMLDAVKQGLLLKGGGHAMAVGLSIHKSKWTDFLNYLTAHFKDDMNNYIPKTKVDQTLSIGAVNVDFAKKIMALEPYGQGNPTPKFKIENVYPTFVMPVGDGHFRVHFKDMADNKLEAMAFRVRGTLLEDVLLNPNNKLHILGTIKYDTWNGCERACFFLEDCILV